MRSSLPLHLRLAKLRHRVATKFRLVEMPVTLPWTGTTYRVLQPASFDRLLTAVADDPEQNLPYWAAIWPSGIALADAILQHPARVYRQPVIELGSGIGVTATAALSAGAQLLVTDYSPETLLLCRANTLRNGGLEPRTLQLNWRKPNETLFADAPYPVVLASDVLYEKRDIEPLLELLDRLVAPGGALWLAEPRRTPAQLFVEAAKAAGWNDELVQHVGPWPDAGDKQIIVNLHWMQRASEWNRNT